ncbi:MAG: acyloxyacyl hydrolase [Deltaproteobacteria bacterium]|nr:MAG: acyloxyacyl hydrolase [Deltaproteobacteria bacterium]
MSIKKKNLTLALLPIVLLVWVPYVRCESSLQKGMTEWGFSVGYGDNFHIGHDVTEDVAFYFLTHFWGRVLKNWSDGGSLEFVAEGFLSFVQQDSVDRYAIGVTPLIAYNLKDFGKVIPFLELGLGILYTDLDPEGFGSRFDFTPQAGFGLRYRIGHGKFLKFSYRIHHVSNADIDEDNLGIDSHLFSVGISFLK